jgi:hypothetical protein
MAPGLCSYSVSCNTLNKMWPRTAPHRRAVASGAERYCLASMASMPLPLPWSLVARASSTWSLTACYPQHSRPITQLAPGSAQDPEQAVPRYTVRCDHWSAPRLVSPYFGGDGREYGLVSWTLSNLEKSMFAKSRGGEARTSSASKRRGPSRLLASRRRAPKVSGGGPIARSLSHPS